MKRTALYVVALCASISVNAQSAGKWIGASDATQVATGVVSDSGAMFGMNCDRRVGSCSWSLSTSNPCNDGASTRMLASSRAGAIHLIAHCIGQSQNKSLWRYRLESEPDGDIGEAVTAGGVLGIAAVQEGGRFLVLRFDVDGAKEAITLLDKAWKAMLSDSGRDQVL